MFRKDELGSHAVVLECSEEDFEFCYTGNDEPLKKCRLSKRFVSMKKNRRYGKEDLSERYHSFNHSFIHSFC